MSKLRKMVALKECSEVITKGTTPSTIGEKFISSGIKFIKSESICDSKYLNSNVFQFIDEETDYKLKRSRLIEGDILFSIAGAYLGKIGIVRDIDLPANTNQAVGIVRLKSNVIDPDYVYYYFSQKHINSYINKLSSQSSQPNLNLDLLGKLEFEFKDLPTQQKIASVLSNLDAKIELNNRINAELEAMAKTLYDYWFVQFDFPDAEGKPYKSSGGEMVWSEELKREIPQGWEIGELSNLFQFNPTLSLKKGAISSYIDMDALPTEGYMTKAVQKKEFNGGVKFKNGDLIVSRITPCLENGKTGLITLLEENEIGFGSTEFIVLRGKKMPLSGFASFLSRSELFRKYAVMNMLGTSGRKRVEASALAKFLIAIPENETLRKFEDFTIPVFQQTTKNVKENQQLAHLRDWLLPMLMNGQVVVE